MDRFIDRNDAGRRLAGKLAQYRGRPETLVLAIPRGGVVVGAVLARELALPLDVVLTKKIGHPDQPEYAIGVVDLESEVIDQAAVERDGIRPEYLRAEIERIRTLLRRRDAEYRAGRRPLDVAGKTIVLTDDGIATGNTVEAAIRLLRKRGAGRIVLAAPVAPADAAARLRSLADDLVCAMLPETFFAIGQFYDDFEQVHDEAAMALLREEEAPRARR